MICNICLIEKDTNCFRKRLKYCIDCENKKKRENYQKNKESELKRVRNYQKTSEKRKEWQKKYYVENSEKLKEDRKEYKRNRRENDPLYKIKNNLSVSIRRAFKNLNYSKDTSVYKAIGCSPDELKSYIESKFESWMNWDNRGLYNGDFNYGWDLDHIMPLSEAKTPEDIIRLNHYTNLQPLCSKINRDIKKDFYKKDNLPLIPSHS